MQNTLTDLDPSVRGQLALLHLTDSALPTGGFSHSLGMEDYIIRGIIHDPDSYQAYIESYIREIATTEGLLARYATECGLEAASGADVADRVAELDALAHASLIPEQVREANASMGKRMGRVVAEVAPDVEASNAYIEKVESGELNGCPAIAFGLAVGGLGVEVRTAVQAYLMQLTTSMNQNAIRGIPIGQTAGQRILAACYPIITETVEHIMQLEMIDLGAAPPGLELAQMHHEQQRSRMFMS